MAQGFPPALLKFVQNAFAIAALAIVFALSSPTLAQGPLSIHGTVTDPSGAVVPNVPIQLQTKTAKAIADARTDDHGGFTLQNLAPGNFVLIVSPHAGFAEKRLPVLLNAPIAALKIALAIEGVTDAVTVGSPTALSPDSAANQDAFTLSAQSLRRLPVFDQNYVAALTPFLDEGSFGSGGVTIIVDGVEMKSAGVSASAIQEVRINSDPYSAEFTSPGRGRIEIITKPGSPKYHGEINFLFRHSTFNATNYFALMRPPEQRRIYEGHLSGPVGHGGHTTFILSGAREEEDFAVAVHAIGADGPIDQNVPTPNRNDQISLRVTHDFSLAHRLSLQYNVEYGTDANGNVGGLSLPSTGVNSNSREDDLVFNDRIIVTPNLIDQLQITVEKDKDVSTSVTNAQSIQVNGAFTGGGAQADSHHTENTIHINEILSWTHKKHYIRFGSNIPQLSRRAVDDNTNRLGTFSYDSLAAFTSSPQAPTSFTITQGIGRGIYWINEVGGFVQDQIQLSQKLQLSVGLRYDWQTYLDDYNNFAPRFSIGYAANKKTVLRTGAGIFYDRTGGDFPAVVKLQNGRVLQTFQVLNPGDPMLFPPGINLTAIPSNIVRFAPGIRSPYSLQYSAGVERQLTKSLTLAAGYRGQFQAKSFRSRDANAPILPPNPDPSANYPRPNPAFGQIRTIESGARQISNALDISLRGDLGEWFSGQVKYTLSRAESNTGGLGFFPQNQYAPNDEWGRTNSDRLHRFNLLGNINPDHWLTLGIALALYSGPPYTATAGADLYHTGMSNARPSGGHRNNLQSAGTANLDLSWDHDFRLTKTKGDDAKELSLQLSAFNVLNHPNFSGIIGNIQSSLFRQPTSASSARQLQLELGYKF